MNEEMTFSSKPSKPLKKRTVAASLCSFAALITLIGCAAPETHTTATQGNSDAQTQQVEPDAVPEPEETAAPGKNLDPAVQNALDSDFAAKAAGDSLFEIQAGQLAVEKAANAQVKQFGQTMVDHHTQATTQLQEVATEKQITLPTEMTAEQQTLLDRLSGLSGADFDRAYMAEMVNAHREDVALFQNQVQQGEDAQFKTWAEQKVPTLQEHLEQAETLSRELSS